MIFQNFPGPGISKNKNPGLCRRHGNPGQTDSLTNRHTTGLSLNDCHLLGLHHVNYLQTHRHRQKGRQTNTVRYRQTDKTDTLRLLSLDVSPLSRWSAQAYIVKNRQMNSQTYRHIHTRTWRLTETDRQTEHTASHTLDHCHLVVCTISIIHTDRQTDRERDSRLSGQTYAETYRRTNKWTDRQMDRQAGHMVIQGVKSVGLTTNYCHLMDLCNLSLSVANDRKLGILP